MRRSRGGAGGRRQLRGPGDGVPGRSIETGDAGREAAAKRDHEHFLTEAEEEEEGAGPLKLAIVGRPNAGKSTLVNKMLGEERMITGPEAGITRDSISLDWQWQDRPVRLVDTAGLRKRAKVEDKLEKLSAFDTKRAIDHELP